MNHEDMKNKCAKCEYCGTVHKDRTMFFGCLYPGQDGKWIVAVKSCPKEEQVEENTAVQEEPKEMGEVQLNPEEENVPDGSRPIFVKPAEEATDMQIKYGGYKGFKAKFDFVMNRTANYFVEIGYMLKEARDTDILKDSGYSGMSEFAEKEYGLRPDQTSRFIGIAEKFGDGHGEILPEYASHGYTKLSEMLTLPGSVAEAIPADLSREDIRTIKSEVAAEQEKTPLEVMMEGRPEDDELNAMLKAYFAGRPEEARQAKTAITEAGPEDKPSDIVLSALAPSGIGVLESRPQGMGRILLSFNGRENQPKLTVIRQDNSIDCSWVMLWHRLKGILENLEIPETEAEPEDKKLKIAPAQMEEKDVQTGNTGDDAGGAAGAKESGNGVSGNDAGEGTGEGEPVPAEEESTANSADEEAKGQQATVIQPVKASEAEELPPMNPPVQTEDPYKPQRGSQDDRDCIDVIKAKREFLLTILNDVKRLKPDEERWAVQDLSEKFENAAHELQNALDDFLNVRLKEEQEG